jgi:hypothetical protein
MGTDTCKDPDPLRRSHHHRGLVLCRPYFSLFVVMKPFGRHWLFPIEANAINGPTAWRECSFNLVPSIIAALGITCCLFLSRQLRVKNIGYGETHHRIGCGVCVYFAIPSGGPFGPGLPDFDSALFQGARGGGRRRTPLLYHFGLRVVFVMHRHPHQRSAAGGGLVNAPVFTMLVGEAVKLITNYILIGLFSGFRGPPWARFFATAPSPF